MANLIVVCGPQAVGKMTVAESLRDKLKYNMMMNHDSIEMSEKLFGFGTSAQKEFNGIFREKALELAKEKEQETQKELSDLRAFKKSTTLKERLTKAGYIASDVQKIVNKMVK